VTVTTAHARLEVNFPLVVGRIFAAQQAPETLLDGYVMPAFFDSPIFLNPQFGVCIHHAILLPENRHNSQQIGHDNPIDFSRHFDSLELHQERVERASTPPTEGFSNLHGGYNLAGWMRDASPKGSRCPPQSQKILLRLVQRVTS
jgi:hypothetical protein